MRVLVAYASEHGSTREIAEWVATRLRGHGVQTTVRSVDGVGDLDGVDAVIVGSAVHDRAWLPAADDFMGRFRDQLAERPLWLFSVGLLGDRGSAFAPRLAGWLRRLRPEPRGVTRLRTSLPVWGHHGFVGVVERDHLPPTGRAMFRLMGGRFGDHRDRAEVDAWADGIAQRLALAAAP